MNLPRKNWLEWSVFAAGLLLVVCTLAYLAYDAITTGNAPPSMQLRLGEAEQRADHFILPVEVTNLGDQTAEGVIVEVALEREGQEPEQGEFEIAFVPRGSTREGWVTFETDPRDAAKITARVRGYEQP